VRFSFPVSAPDEAWAALADPERLAAALPGCRSVERVPGDSGDGAGGGVLRVVADVDVAAVRGLWSGHVTPVDGDAVRLAGSGAPGTLDLVVRADPARTTLTVEGTVDGPLATVGSSVLAAAVRRTAERVLAELAAPIPVTEPVDIQPIASPESPASAEGRTAHRARQAVTAAGVVAVIVVGRRRRARRSAG
jgi:carbon monoxide dehydrogenase subunit G